MAFPFKFGSEFLVNTTTIGSQMNPTITGLADGRFVVSWQDNSETGGDTSGWAVRAQIFNADGSMAGAEFLVNTTTALAQTASTITGLADGGFVASWTDFSQSGGDMSGRAVRAQVFNIDGSKAGDEFLVNTTTNNNQHQPTITALVDGRFVTSWTDTSASGDGLPSGWAIRAQIFNGDGSKAGGEFLVNTTTANLQQLPSITGLADGRFVVSWTDSSASDGDTTGGAIRAQIFNGDGSMAGSEFLVNTTTAGAQTNPSITGLADGRFVVSWKDNSQTGGDTSGSAIRAQVFNGDGSLSGGEILVNSTTDNNQTEPSITGLGDGRFVISWRDIVISSGDDSDSDVRAQVFDIDGSKVGEEFLVHGPSSEGQWAPSVTALADGRFVVSWTDSSETGSDTSSTSVRAQIFDPRESGVMLTGSNLGDDFIGTKFGDSMVGKAGMDTLLGRGGRDDLSGNKGNDILKGNAGKDTLAGGIGHDMLFGGKGSDDLTGGKGRDTLNGGAGKDNLFGNAGKDKITGGKGQDDLTGGAGADRFIFNSVSDSGKTVAKRDVITDFSQAQGDVIDLSGIDAKSGGGNQDFDFIGSSGFSGAKGELRYKQTATKTIVQGDVDGDGVKDFEIELSGVITLTADDFIL